MDIEATNSQALGKTFYNQIQVLEFLVCWIFSTFTQMTIMESTDDCTRIQIDHGEEKVGIKFTYLSGGLVIDSDKFTQVIFPKHYIRQFDRKAYTVDSSKKFTALLRLEYMRNLFACVKREFRHTPSIFNQLSRNMIGEILSFLDNKSLLRFICVKRELYKAMDYDQIWRRMYYARFGNTDLKVEVEGLNWKKIYLKDRKSVPNKSVPIRNSVRP